MHAVLDQLQTWEAMSVALLGGFLWLLPLKGRWPLWHDAIGVGLVLLVGLASAAVNRDMGALVTGALQGWLGFCGSIVLVRAMVLTHAAGRRIAARRRARGEGAEP